MRHPGSPAVLHVDLHRGWSGGQDQLLRLAHGLRDRGHEPWIATPPEGPLAVRAAEEGLAVVPHDVRGEIDPRGAGGLAAAVRRLGPCIVHAHDPHGLAQAAVAARLAGLRLPDGRPAVVAHRRVDFPIRRHPLSRWKHARGPDRVIAVSRHVRDVLVAGGVPRERIAVVPDGVEAGPPAPSASARRTLRERIGAAADTRLVVTLAAFVPRKDPATLVAAAERVLARVPAARWVVMGDGPLLGAIRAEVERRGLAGRLHCPGFVADAARLLAGADAFVLTSRREALGVAVLEAMSAGVPVVATRVGGIPEAVEDGRSGLLVPPGDAAALAAAVEGVLGDATLARRLGAAARDRARDFSAARMVEGVERVYGEALGAERARRSTPRSISTTC